MKIIFSLSTFFFFITTSVWSQNIVPSDFTEPLNTGQNMTIGFNVGNSLSSFIGQEIGAFKQDGTCVGLAEIEDAFFTMAIWGNDSETGEGGLSFNEIPVFALLTENHNVAYMQLSIQLAYSTNSLVVTTSLDLYGCTNPNYLEFHTQGYTADIDNESCETETFSLDISPELFNNIPQTTDQNMVVGMSTSILNSFDGGLLGAFYDLNGDGNLELLNSSGIPSKNNGANGFFTISLWGNEEYTDEVDGLLTGQTPIFAVLTPENYVLAFEAVPEFSGYISNSEVVVYEVNFDLTVYGCMDAAYCNYNPDAEEDDGSCEGFPGCTSDYYIEFDENAGCELIGACITTWEDGYNSSVAASEVLEAVLSNTQEALATSEAELLSEQEINAGLQNQVNNLSSNLADTQEALAASEAELLSEQIINAGLQNQVNDLSSNLANAQEAIAAAETELLSEQEINAGLQNQVNDLSSNLANTQEALAAAEAPIIIDISEGWNIIGYTLKEEQDVVATFAEAAITDSILIIKNNNADVYWPEFSFNGIGNLIPGQGYQMKMRSPIFGFSFPNTSGNKIHLTPTVPQWVIDMPVEVHPNDIRSLSRVVNTLGQEVNLEDTFKGETLIYLYNDGTVEKKIKE